MGGIRINIHDPKDSIVIEKRSKKNILIINNVLSKRKMKRKKSDIDISNDSWRIIGRIWFSGKSKPVGMIRNP